MARWAGRSCWCRSSTALDDPPHPQRRGLGCLTPAADAQAGSARGRGRRTPVTPRWAGSVEAGQLGDPPQAFGGGDDRDLDVALAGVVADIEQGLDSGRVDEGQLAGVDLDATHALVEQPGRHRAHLVGRVEVELAAEGQRGDLVVVMDRQLELRQLLLHGHVSPRGRPPGQPTLRSVRRPRATCRGVTGARPVVHPRGWRGRERVGPPGCSAPQDHIGGQPWAPTPTTRTASPARSPTPGRPPARRRRARRQRRARAGAERLERNDRGRPGDGPSL